MNYRRIYDEFVADRRGREAGLARFERHHVVPRFFGGGDEPSNLVRLSPGDHLFAHVLLAKIHGGMMAVCVVRMLGMKKYEGRRSRLRYRAFRDEHARTVSASQKGVNPFSVESRARGVAKSSETLKRSEHRDRLTRQGIEASACPEFRRKRSELMTLASEDEEFQKKRRASVDARFELMRTVRAHPGSERLKLPRHPGGSLPFWKDCLNRLENDRAG